MRSTVREERPVFRVVAREKSLTSTKADWKHRSLLCRSAVPSCHKTEEAGVLSVRLSTCFSGPRIQDSVDNRPD